MKISRLKTSIYSIFLLTILVLSNQIGYCQDKEGYDIVVDADGRGNFRSVSEAIESLPMYNYERVTIYVKNGIYQEKLRIDRDYVTIIGESRDSVFIEYNQLRSDWKQNPDYIGPAVVNIYADDIILKNLTIENTQPLIGPHAFAIYGTGTRTVLLNCSVISKGGDTVSLWNYKQGMYYHSNCFFEGAVDFVCPRGWCFIRDSKFYEVKKTASVWHAAVNNPNQKFVLENCSFNGVKGFELARHHYDAAFYLLNCTFSDSMKDKPIEHVVYKDEPERNRPYFYGNRYYFYNCHRTGGDYPWFKNNVNTWPDGVTPGVINASWTFDGKWNPEDTAALTISGYKFTGKYLYLYFNELVGIKGNVKLKTPSGKMLNFEMGRGRDTVEFSCDDKLEAEDFTGGKCRLISGEVYALRATVHERILSDHPDIGYVRRGS